MNSTTFRQKNRPLMTYIEPAVIHTLINKDKNFQIQMKAVRTSYSCLERYNKQHFRMKVEAVKNKLIDDYICKFVVRRQVIINLTAKLVKKYWSELHLSNLSKLPKKVEVGRTSQTSVIDANLIGKINKAMKSFWRNKKKPLISDYQKWLYLNYKGSDRFLHTKVAYDYYVDTGKEPYYYS